MIMIYVLTVLVWHDSAISGGTKWMKSLRLYTTFA